MDRNEMMAKYLSAKIDEDIYKEVVKIFKKEQEKAYLKELKALRKKNKKEIRRNGRTKLLR